MTAPDAPRRPRGEAEAPPPEPPMDPRLRAVLEAEAALEHPTPSAAYVADLRASFVRGDFGGDDAPDAALSEALDRPTPPARAEFRDELRRRFLESAAAPAPEAAGDGSLELDALEPLEAPAPRARREAARPPRRRAAHGGGRRSAPPAPARGSRRRFQLGAVLGAVLLGVGAFLWAPWASDGPSPPAPTPWSLQPGVLASVVEVDGQALDPGLTPEQLTARLTGARRVVALEDHVRLQYGRRFVVQLHAGTALDLGAVERAVEPDGADPDGGGEAAPAGPDAPRHHELAMLGLGGVQVATGPEFRKGVDHLAVVTDEARVRVTGTVFAVDRYDDGTCVCCLEGTVDVEPRNGLDVTSHVEGEHMDYVFREEKRMLGDIMPPHREPMVPLLEHPW